jgi:NADH-quinone oxidoreductase subunit L
MLVHIFSLGYMKDDEAKPRYFAGLSLFMFSMTGIVLANNFIMMFIFWELVGCQLLPAHRSLVSEASAADAGEEGLPHQPHRRLWFHDRHPHPRWGSPARSTSTTSRRQGHPAVASTRRLQPNWLTLAPSLCIFCGAVGKSAQFPLHVWLPDAMEGPTPVSALIHAATMVAAGRLHARSVSAFPRHAVPSSRRTVIAWIGGFTALLAALMATQQNDIKRILAYSTLSQLGYMVMAVRWRSLHAAIPVMPACSTSTRTLSSRRCSSSAPAR